jgi:adenylate cyclase
MQHHDGIENRQEPERLRFAGLVLDLDGRSLTDAVGKDVPLTPSEFVLLASFVRGAGRALSRDHLLQAVAGRESESFDRSIDVLVGRLRRKIEPDPKTPRLIVTVPGVGYKFAVRPAPAGMPGPMQAAPAAEPDRPSLAVLPFANLSGDPEQDYFADGIVEELTNALSRVRWFFVIARNSSFTYKGRAVDVRQVGRELGVRYVLEGSVRKAGGRVRIAAELVETEVGAHVWADRFEGDLADVFDLQDRITERVVAIIEPRLLSAELARVRRQRPENPSAYDLFLRGMAHFYIDDAPSTLETLRLLSQAIVSDPGYAPPYALAAQCHLYRIYRGWSPDPEADRLTGADLARTAVQRDPADPTVLALAGHAIGYLTDDYDASLALIDQSLALNPNSAMALQLGGYARLYAGDPETAAEYFERGMRLNPVDPKRYILYSGLSVACSMLGRAEEALAMGRKAVSNAPHFLSGHVSVAAALALVGRLDEARQAAARVLELVPTYRASRILRSYKPSAAREVYLNGLRRAGVPD